MYVALMAIVLAQPAPAMRDYPQAPPIKTKDAVKGEWPERLLHWRAQSVKYNRALMTQRVFNRNMYDVTYRYLSEPKWRFPGGLAEIDGWKSELRAYIPNDYQEFSGPLDVLNSFNNYQTERSIQRRFPNGTYFIDALYNANNGNLFEIRLREKVDGEWESDVLYRSAKDRPLGYAPVKIAACAECHNQAGTGGYSSGLVPGGDGTLSYPMSFEKTPVGPWFSH